MQIAAVKWSWLGIVGSLFLVTYAIATPLPSSCTIFRQAAHNARANLFSVNSRDAEALYDVVSKLRDADKMNEPCLKDLDDAKNSAAQYDILLEDSQLLLYEAVAFSRYKQNDGPLLGDLGGRDTNFLQTLAVKQLHMIANDTESPRGDEIEARRLLTQFDE